MNILRISSAGAIAALFLGPVIAVAQTQYTATFLPPGFDDKAINNAGQIVGTWQGSAAIFDSGTTIVLPIPASTGKDINARRDVVGQLASGHAFAYIGRRLIDLQHALPRRFTSSDAKAINHSGEAVGVAAPEIGESYRGFVYRKGTVRTIPTFGGDWSWATAINDRGVVAGYASYGGPALSQYHHAFLFFDGRMQQLGTFGGLNSEANGINNRNEVVGSADYASGVSHPFLYERGRMIDLGTLGGEFGSALAINNAGVVVGQTDLASHLSTGAFLYRNHRMFDLSKMVALPVGWHLLSAEDINDVGQILATACGPTSCGSVRLDPIAKH